MLSIVDNKSGKTLSFIMIAAWLALFSSVTSAAPGDEEIIWQGGYDYVAIVAKDGARNPGNQHPVQLTPRNIYQLLMSIRITEAEDEGVTSKLFGFFSDDDEKKNKQYSFDDAALEYDSLFTDAEAKKISAAISQGLSQARPHQDIAFSVSGRHEGLLGKTQLSTTARVFYSNDALHLIFGEVYVDIAKKFRRKGHSSGVAEKIEVRELRSFRLKQGQRDDSSDLPVQFVLGSAHTVSKYNGELRRDWLVIDLNRFEESLSKARNVQTSRGVVRQDTTELQQKTKDIDQEQEQLKRKVDRLERLIEAKERAVEVAPVAPAKPVQQKSLEQRLTELKRLYEKGFISEAIYNEKMRKLLNEL